MLVRPALFLDRDGVINVDHGHVHKIEDFEFIPGIFELARKANQAGWLVIIVTNQAGIAKGYYTEEAFRTLMDWVCEQFRQNGAKIDAVYHCSHHPDFGDIRECACRKPLPGMFLAAAAAHGIDLSASVMIGDHDTDILAASRASIRQTYLVRDKTVAGVKYADLSFLGKKS
jgi:D-glycero-D-manno-heptose 1,7-bisphosphate phosphatase